MVSSAPRTVVVAAGLCDARGGDGVLPVALALSVGAEDAQVFLGRDVQRAGGILASSLDFILVAVEASRVLATLLGAGVPLPTTLVDLSVEDQVIRALPRRVTSSPELLNAYGLMATPCDWRHPHTNGPDPLLTASDALVAATLCKEVRAVSSLWGRMSHRVHVHPAVERGSYLAAAASVERAGIPIDVPIYTALSRHLDGVRRCIIEEHADFRMLYSGSELSPTRLSAWAKHRSIDWPRDAYGLLDVSARALGQVSRLHPDVQGLVSLERVLNQLVVTDWKVGADGRARTPVGAFGTNTGRNQARSAQSVFSSPRWMRALVQASPGHALVYADWHGQEFAAAGHLSRDPAMVEAYTGGDPYEWFARQTGPGGSPNGLKARPSRRERFKKAALSIQNGIGHAQLALDLDVPVENAREMLASHRRLFSSYWSWAEDLRVYSMLAPLVMPHGWRGSPRSSTAGAAASFYVQAACAEMLRSAAVVAMGACVPVIALVHDALLVEVPLEQEREVTRYLRASMNAAAAGLLGSSGLRVDVKRVPSPARLVDPTRDKTFQHVFRHLVELETPLRFHPLLTSGQVRVHT